MIRSTATGFSLLLGLALVVACIDTTPLARTEPGMDGGNMDGSAGDGSVDSRCRSCITDEAGACYATYERCLSTAPCPELMECLLGRQCFQQPSFEARIACAIPCTEQVGISDVTHPAINLNIEINVCVIEKCTAECPPLP